MYRRSRPADVATCCVGDRERIRDTFGTRRKQFGGSIWIVWCGGITTNVTQKMKANFIEQLGLLFEDLLQRFREPSPAGTFPTRRTRDLTLRQICRGQGVYLHVCQRKGQNASTWKRLSVCRSIRVVEVIRSDPSRRRALGSGERHWSFGGQEY